MYALLKTSGLHNFVKRRLVGKISEFKILACIELFALFCRCGMSNLIIVCKKMPENTPIKRFDSAMLIENTHEQDKGDFSPAVILHLKFMLYGYCSYTR